MNTLKEQAYQMKEAVLKGNVELGIILNKSWASKAISIKCF